MNTRGTPSKKASSPATQTRITSKKKIWELPYTRFESFQTILETQLMELRTHPKNDKGHEHKHRPHANAVIII